MCPRIRYKIDPILSGPVPGNVLKARRFGDSLQVGLSKSGRFNLFTHQGDSKFSRFSNTKTDTVWRKGQRHWVEGANNMEKVDSLFMVAETQVPFSSRRESRYRNV